MRAIDADAFAEFLKNAVKQQKYENVKIDELLTVADVIEAIISELDGTSLGGFKNAPTIEPQRKKEMWIKHIDDLFPAESTIECSGCHHEQPLTIDDNFCPNCGAEMEGQDE